MANDRGNHGTTSVVRALAPEFGSKGNVPAQTTRAFSLTISGRPGRQNHSQPKHRLVSGYFDLRLEASRRPDLLETRKTGRHLCIGAGSDDTAIPGGVALASFRGAEPRRSAGFSRLRARRRRAHDPWRRIIQPRWPGGSGHWGERPGWRRPAAIGGPTTFVLSRFAPSVARRFSQVIQGLSVGSGLGPGTPIDKPSGA